MKKQKSKQWVHEPAKSITTALCILRDILTYMPMNCQSYYYLSTLHCITFVFLSTFSNSLEEKLLHRRWRIAFRSSDWFWLRQVKLLQNSCLPFHIENNSNEVFSVQCGEAAEAICTDTNQASFAKKTTLQQNWWKL